MTEPENIEPVETPAAVPEETEGSPVIDGLTYGGLVMEVSENDFILGGNIEIDLDEHQAVSGTVHEYDQSVEYITRNACSVFASAAALDDLVGNSREYPAIKALWNQAIKQGAVASQGWYFYKAVDLVRKNWNADHIDRKVSSFRISSGEFLQDALDRGYTLVAGYRGNAAYNSDKNDGTLSGTSFPNWTYGHCVRIRKVDGSIQVVDNYKGKVDFNIYTLEHFQELLDNGVFFNEFYLFVYSSILTDSQRKRLWSKGKGLWNGLNENSFSTRGEVAEMAVNAAVKVAGSTILNSNPRDQAKDMGVWNGEGENEFSTRLEAATMITRATSRETVWSGNDPDSPVTRGEVSEMIANTFANR